MVFFTLRVNTGPGGPTQIIIFYRYFPIACSNSLSCWLAVGTSFLVGLQPTCIGCIQHIGFNNDNYNSFYCLAQSLCIICSSVLSAHSATTVSSNGMCGHTDHTFQPSPLPCISVRCSTEFNSTLFIRSLRGTPIGHILWHIPRAVIWKRCCICSSQGSPEAIS